MSLPIDIRPGMPGSSGEPKPQRSEVELANQCFALINQALKERGIKPAKPEEVSVIKVSSSGPFSQDFITRKGFPQNFPLILISSPSQTNRKKHVVAWAENILGSLEVREYLDLDFHGVLGSSNRVILYKKNDEIVALTGNTKKAPNCRFVIENDPGKEVVLIAKQKPDENHYSPHFHSDFDLVPITLPVGWREALGNAEKVPSEPADTKEPSKAEETKPSPEKAPTQEDYDMFVEALSEKLREMNVLPRVQKLDPTKVFLPETIIQEHFGDSRNSDYLGQFGISSLPFLFYGDVSKATKVKVDVEFERDYVQLIFEFPQIHFFSLEDTGNGPHIKKRFYDPSFQLKPEAIPVGTRENSEFINVIAPIPDKLFSMRMGSIEEPMRWQRLFRDGKLVDRNSLSRGDLFERAKKRIDNLPSYSGLDMKVAKGTKTAVLEGQRNVSIRAISQREEVAITLTGLNKNAVEKWLDSNPRDFSTLPAGGKNDNDWLILRVKIMDGELQIQAAIAGLNPIIKREAEVRPQEASVLETPLMFTRLLNSLRVGKVPAVIFDEPRENSAPRNNRTQDRNRRSKGIRFQRVADATWEEAKKGPVDVDNKRYPDSSWPRFSTQTTIYKPTARERKAAEAKRKQSFEAQQEAQKAKYKSEKAQ